MKLGWQLIWASHLHSLERCLKGEPMFALDTCWTSLGSLPSESSGDKPRFARKPLGWIFHDVPGVAFWALHLRKTWTHSCLKIPTEVAQELEAQNLQKFWETVMSSFPSILLLVTSLNLSEKNAWLWTNVYHSDIHVRAYTRHMSCKFTWI